MILEPDPLSKEFLTERGWCCGSGCTNCPYEPKHRRGNTKLEVNKKLANNQTDLNNNKQEFT